MVYGYARVSTTKQIKGNSLEEQRSALKNAGAQEIVEDSYNGTTVDRPNFKALCNKLCPGDKLVITKLDRFARTVTEGVTLVKQLLSNNIIIHILNMGIIDNSPMGRLMVTMLLAFAEFERDMIVERTQSGKSIARANGLKVDGRPPKFSNAQVRHALDLLKDHSYTEVAKMTGISKSTLVRNRRVNDTG